MLLFLFVLFALLMVWSVKYLRKTGHRFLWITSPVRFSQKRAGDSNGPISIYVAICDHFEPFWGNVYQEIAEHRVATWCREFSRASREHTDFLGNHPKHTFFYSEQDYNPLLLDSLQKLCRDGYGDVELLLTHHDDTVQHFRHRIEEIRDVLFFHHGLLRKDNNGNIIYGFIHGHWALNNSRPDGRKCGVNNEIPLLKQSGCYADFTYPSAPDITQPRIINSIYFAADTPGIPCAHQRGYAAERECWSDNDLLLIQGPLSLNWKNGYLGLLPTIENGGLSHNHRYYQSRADCWVRSAVHISGIKDHIFIKLFTHGAIDKTMQYFFTEKGLHQMWQDLETRYNDGKHYRLYYVTAYEMYLTVKNLCIGNKVSHNK